MKKTKFGSVFSALLVCFVLLLWFCLSASAADIIDSGSCGDNLTYTLDSDGVLTISGTGNMTSSPWSSYKTQIKTVTINDNVTFIDNAAFEDCTRLTSVTIGNGVASIGLGAFSGCTGLTSVTIPDSVTSIGSYAFSGCTGLTIYGKSGSYAETYAKQNNIPFRIYYSANADSYSTNVASGANQQCAADSLTIRPYASDAGTVFASLLADTIIDWGGNSLKTSNADFQVVIKNSAITSDIKISETNHRTYIIPFAVTKQMTKISDGTVFSAYLTAKDGKTKYISSVIAKKDSDSADKFIDLCHSKLECRKDEKASVYISAVGLTNPTYYITQDSRHMLSNKTGIFTAIDVYNTFEAGAKIAVYAVDADGSKTEAVEIKLSKKAELSTAAKALTESTTINLFGSSGVEFDISDKFPILGGTSIDFSAFKFPIGVSVDGTKVKISLGFDFFENKKNYETGKWEKEWKSFKDNIKGLSETLSKYKDTSEKYKKNWNSLENLKKQYSGKNIIKSGDASKDKGWTCSFLGYIECDIDNNGDLVFSEGSLLAAAKFNFKYSQQCAVWAIPAYYYFECDAKASLEGLIERIVPERSCPVDWSVTLKVEPKVAVGAGAGIVNFASVGLRGEATLPTSIEFKNGHLTMDLTGTLYAEVRILFITGQQKIVDGTLHILDKYLWNNTKRLVQKTALPQEVSEETVISVMDRDYADSTSGWLGSASPIRKAKAAASNSQENTFKDLQTDVYNQSQAQTVTTEDGQLMVYVADKADRDDYNRLCLMYSVYKNGSWSEPEAVCDDGMNDNAPSLVTDGENVWVAWQKVTKKLTAADCTGIETLMANTEICLAKYDVQTGSFAEPVRITNNNVYDYLPTVTIKNGSAGVYYAEGSPDENTNKIIYFNGESSEIVKDSLSCVLALACNGDEISYTVDPDPTDGTTGDINVFTVNGTKTTEFEKYSDENTDTSGNAYSCLAYGIMDGKETLLVSDGSSVYYVRDGKTEKAFSTVASVCGDLRTVSSDDTLILLWTGYTDDGAVELYTCSYRDGKWGEPVLISGLGKTISGVSAVCENDTVYGVCNVTTAGTDRDTTNLVSFTFRDFTDISITAFAPDETTVVPGEDALINTYITQNGTNNIEKLQITVSDTSGNRTSFAQSVDLQAGETVNLDIPYRVPENYTGATVTVTVAAADVAERNDEDNSAAVELGKTTVTICEQPIAEFDEYYLLPLTVENDTSLSLTGMTLRYEIENFDDTTENEGATLPLDDFTANSYDSVQISVRKTGLVYNEDGFAKIKITVYQNDTEITSETVTIERNESDVVYGDINGEDGVTAADARLALRASVKLETLTEAQTKAADVDGSGELTAADARLILRYSVKLETKFPVEK